MTGQIYHALGEELPWGGCSVEELLGRVRGGASRLALSGLVGGSLAWLAAQLVRAFPERTIVVVTPEHQRAYQLYEDLQFFCGEDPHAPLSRLSFYGADEILPYSEMLPDRGAIQSRLCGLLQIQHQYHPVMVMPAAALVRRVLPKGVLSKSSDLIEVAEEVDRETLLHHLVGAGYQRVPVVEDRGTFSVRGAVLDIFSPLYSFPARIELDDQLVMSIRFFEPTTQRKVAESDDLLVGPVDEILRNPENLSWANRRFAAQADILHYPTREWRQLLDDLREDVRPFGVQAMIPGFYERLESLAAYLPKDAIAIIDEPRDVMMEIRSYTQRMQESYASLCEEGRFAFPPEEFLLSEEETERLFRSVCRVEHQSVLVLDGDGTSVVDLGADEESGTFEQGETSHAEERPEERAETTADESKSRSDGQDGTDTFASKESAEKGDVGRKLDVGGVRWGDAGELILPYVSLSQQGLKQLLRSIPASQEHRLQPLVERIRLWQSEGLVVAIACGTKGQSLRLRELLELYDVDAQLLEDGFSMSSILRKDVPRERVHIFLGRISEGFVFPRARLVLISEEEIFGPKARRSKAKKKGPLLETELQSLQTGDLVIHREHGMARYGGLHSVDIGGVRGDFLLLEYHGNDRLYLPVTKLNLIERFTGGGDPSLDRLKSNTFEKKKSKARAAIQAIAGDLLKLYASRQLHTGDPIEISPELYAEFEARFPFEETPDQAQAIHDVLGDMRAGRCMDRLVCGDVGYGKTEVAIRAAFVAAFSGRQVAVLVPTTVLAQQHGLNFMERFDGYPIKIAVLSRFQSAKELKDTIKLLGEGKIDIVIGTHRLLSRDVHFKNLGLLIIDEEQRFGVKHKERIKQYRAEIDVLTLTATPIPRTLEMSMVGARDLSLITTPPVDRLAIRTTVAPLGDEIVREAVMRELHRGGQVFFVHNRIEDIGKMQNWLHSIVPEARVVVGHGQMPEGELERVMLDFVQGKYNILLCTSIIESGLDIPRANTILVNRADTFGLAQLYQIRGRVGRGKERAYAVLLVPSDARINPEAKQRLATLQRFTELGAGFEIARHDLEMRGAGNLLGKEQSGHIHAIGLELYMEMLQEAVAELQGRPVDVHLDPEVKLGVDAYLPDYYVPDIQLRLQCYRRLSTAVETDELDQLSEEFEDRFGPLPTESKILFQMMEIRLMLKRLFATSGELSGEKFRVFFHPQAPLDHERILQSVQKKEPLFRLLPQGAIESVQPIDKKGNVFSSIRSFLRDLPELVLRRPEPTEES
ncbi:MAG: transcription-repair coupling factor [Myxococcales bacterium]|nr:transcription-repair coupling factor [Myxococcales bacterium]